MQLLKKKDFPSLLPNFIPECKKRYTVLTQYKTFYGERNGNPLQYSCLEKSMDRGVWRAEVHGIT